MATHHSNFIRDADLSAQLPELLARVGEGERITITSGGAPIARIVPVRIRPAITPEEREKLINRWLEISKDIRLGDDLDLKDLINEGRP